MKKAWLTLIFGSAILLAACGSGEKANDVETEKDTEETVNIEKAENETSTETNTEQETEESKSEGNFAVEPTSDNPETIVQRSCIACHGEDLTGGAAAPSIADVGSRLSQEEILAIIQNGQGGMPGGLITSHGEEMEIAVAEYLASLK